MVKNNFFIHILLLFFKKIKYNRENKNYISPTLKKKIYSSSSSSSVSSEKLANESSSTTSFNFNVF